MTIRVLIVEDECIVQVDLRNQLQRMGYLVAGMASRGEEAVALAAELQPDLILMDVRLRGEMNGIEAMHQIRAVKNVPVVYLTAYDWTHLEANPIEDAYPTLSKPFRAAELQIAISQALGATPLSESSELNAKQDS